MARQTCRTCLEQARLQAAALLAQGRQLSGRRPPDPAPSAPMEAEEPMNRYIHPIPASAGRQEARGAGQELQAGLERVLECMACQNQLLVDILGAINALTAAVLSTQSRNS